MNGVQATEDGSNGNFWNTSDTGNYWKDFENNPGYPNYYRIPGTGNGIDWHPNILTTDMDGDGIPDENDNCPVDYNPLQEDFDGDGIGDVCDNCPSVWNPGQEDRNGDGIGDACTPTDLIITPGGIIFSDDYPLKNESMTITAIFHNLLSDDPEEVLVRFYNATPSNASIIGEQVVLIGRQSDFFAQIDWTPPYEGDLDIHVFVDPEDDIVESNETNNIASKTLHVQTKPDIRIRDSDIAFTNNNPQTGDNITIIAMIRNIESVPTGEFIVRFYDNTWGNVIAEKTMSLEPFQTQISQTWWTAPGGNHTIGIYCDSTYVVDEMTETNNLGRKTILVRRPTTGSSSPIFRKQLVMQG